MDLKEEPKTRYDELLGVVAEDDYSEILMWYISCADDLLYDLPYEENVENYLEWRLNQLDNISEKDLEDEWHKCNCCAFKYNDCNCKKFRNGVKSREITAKNASFIMLGRFCISSFEGDIPYTVVQKLEEITAYNCNHMG